MSAIASGKLSEEDVKEMLANMELAAPEDVALVKLLSKWAKRGQRSSPEPQVHIPQPASLKLGPWLLLSSHPLRRVCSSICHEKNFAKAASETHKSLSRSIIQAQKRLP